MSSYFSGEDLERLGHGRKEVQKQFSELRELYLLRAYKEEKAREHASHGFIRRLGTLVRAIEQVFTIVPPAREDSPPSEDLKDATIAIQAFVLNVFGCLDNLAWIWVYEKGIKAKNGSELSPRDVGFGSRSVRFTFSAEFQAYLNSRQQWFEALKEFRDSLAHRIPLYIPPYVVDVKNFEEYNHVEAAISDAFRKGEHKEYDRLILEQKKLGRFRPWMAHSQLEASPSIVFHVQMLADYVTVDEFGRAMLQELDRS